MTFRNDDIVVLDCTFRDGGYYTNWHFDDAVLKDYLIAVSNARVNVMEVGYLAPTAVQCGRFKVDRLDKFNFLPPVSGRHWAVMVDSKAFLSLSEWKKAIREALLDAKDTVIDIVRIASHYGDLQRLPELIAEVASMGYRPVLNIMQIDNASSAEIDEIFAFVSRIDGVETVYLADSFGSMTPNRVTPLMSRLASLGRMSVGFHAHDNMGMALLNSVAAMNAGATWIDSTFAGMGRGAGNTATEELCMLLDGDGNDNFNTLLERHFSALKERHGWGRSFLYRLAAQRKLHPMYVQSLSSIPALDARKLAEIVRAIPSAQGAVFDRNVLEAVLHEH